MAAKDQRELVENKWKWKVKTGPVVICVTMSSNIIQHLFANTDIQFII